MNGSGLKPKALRSKEVIHCGTEQSRVVFGRPLSLLCGEESSNISCQLNDLRNIYEPFLASRAIPQSGMCLDIGAGVGWFGLAFASLFAKWTVVCVEPDLKQFELLEANVERLGLDNVVCINAAFHPEASLLGGNGATELLSGGLEAHACSFQRLLGLPGKVAPVVGGGVSTDGDISCPALPPSLINDLSPDFVRIDAPGCEDAIAEALRFSATGYIVGRSYPYISSQAFQPLRAGIDRQVYVVHGEHALRIDFEDNLSERRPSLDVVVAMYNARDYICECVDSLLADGNSQVQVIVVDDGSTDGSGDLVEAIYGNNSRVKLLRKRNGGCASARNFGRRHSSASHIAFVDADDRVDSSMFTSLLEVARYTGAFVVEGEFKTFVRDENGADEFELSYEAVSYQSNGRHGLSDIEYDWIPGSQIIVGQPTIWRRIHRRDFLDRKDVWFPEHVRAFDDQIFQVYVGVYAGAIAHVRGQFYHYRQHPAQDIRQGDERHFYSFNMFRTILLRSLDEGWSDVFPILQSLINTMAWSYSGLRDDLKPIYSDAAVEFLAVYEMTFGEKVPKRMLERTGIPGLSFLVPLRVQKMAAKQVSYGMMRLESWRWQPEFIRMMVKALE